jgi:hypothetical protein
MGLAILLGVLMNKIAIWRRVGVERNPLPGSYANTPASFPAIGQVRRKIVRSILDVIPVKALTRPTQIFLFLAILTLAGCSSLTTTDADGGGGGGGGGKKGKKGGGGAAGAAVPVTVATATQQNVPIEVTAVGTVEAYTTISVKSLVTGELTDFFFKEGDYVKKGDKLFSIDSRTYEAALKQAEANLLKDRALQAQAVANLKRDTASQQYARDTAERYQGLLKDGIVSRDQTDRQRPGADGGGPGQHRQPEGAVELLLAVRHH